MNEYAYKLSGSAQLRSDILLLLMSGIPELNWRLILGKDAYYHCTNPA